jgi:SSS family solute:Na+ symporter
VDLNNWEIAIFIAYLLLTVAVGFLVSRGGRKSAKAYFIGDKRLPWYVIGTSMVATAISSDHFIAQVGGGYQHGVVIAAFGWNSWIVYTLLIWIFLPYYMRTGLYTMPEFLERRYNSSARYVFAIFCVVGYLFSLIAGPLYAGGLALETMFGMDLVWAIVLLGVLTGAYTIYGGLKSAAWTDFMQMGVLLVGGGLGPVELQIPVAGRCDALRQRRTSPRQLPLGRRELAEHEICRCIERVRHRVGVDRQVVLVLHELQLEALGDGDCLL